MRKLSLLLFLGVFSAQAQTMSDSLRMAVFMFEMQGRFHEAHALFTRMAQSPQASIEEQTQARFYLGKMAELASQPESARHHYSVAQYHAKHPAMAYWLADRRAALDPQPMPLLQGIQKLPALPLQAINTRRNSLLLANQQLWTLQNNRFAPATQQAPEGSVVHTLDAGNLWYSDHPSSHILHRLSIWNPTHANSFFLDGPIEAAYPISEQQLLATTAHSIFWLNNDRILWKKRGPLQKCKGIGLYSPTRQLVLSCPDNALHFLSTENGTEQQTLALVEKMDHSRLTDEGVLVQSAGALHYYQPHLLHEPRWSYQRSVIQDYLPWGQRIAVLGTNGSLELISLRQGQLLAQSSSDGSQLTALGTGLLGTLTDDGLLTAFDTALVPLWTYHFASPIQVPPLITPDALFFPLRNSTVASLSPRFYGKSINAIHALEKRAVQIADSGHGSRVLPLIDSLLQLEKGNATAWYLKARNTSPSDTLHTRRTWATAVQYARGKTPIATSVLQGYAKQIKAQWVRYLEVSPRTLYPRIFGDTRQLYVIDASARRLMALSSQKGELRWTVPLNQLEQSPVISTDPRTLVVGSGFQIEIFDLAQKGRSRTLALPGKPFQLIQNPEALYVSTWNGFILKFSKAGWQLEWSHKAFPTPIHLAESSQGILLLSQDGQMAQLNSQGQALLMGRTDSESPAIYRSLSPYVVIASQEDAISIMQESPGFPLLTRFTTESQILSLELLKIQEEPYALVGLSDQRLILYALKSGKPQWSFQGQGSVFVQPAIEGGVAWIDQTDALVGISLQTGRIVQRMEIPGGTGPLFANGGFLYGASRQRLLYAFPAPNQSP